MKLRFIAAPIVGINAVKRFREIITRYTSFIKHCPLSEVDLFQDDTFGRRAERIEVCKAVHCIPIQLFADEVNAVLACIKRFLFLPRLNVRLSRVADRLFLLGSDKPVYRLYRPLQRLKYFIQGFKVALVQVIKVFVLYIFSFQETLEHVKHILGQLKIKVLFCLDYFCFKVVGNITPCAVVSCYLALIV